MRTTFDNAILTLQCIKVRALSMSLLFTITMIKRKYEYRGIPSYDCHFSSIVALLIAIAITERQRISCRSCYWAEARGSGVSWSFLTFESGKSETTEKSIKVAYVRDDRRRKSRVERSSREKDRCTATLHDAAGLLVMQKCSAALPFLLERAWDRR